MLSVLNIRQRSITLSTLYAIFLTILCRIPQSQGYWIVLLYLLCFGIFMQLVATLQRGKSLLLLFCLFAIVCSLQYPYLSNDYFRFLWDGQLQHAGINPFDYQPPAALQNIRTINCTHLDSYAGISELSKSNFSCYPTLNQGYFFLATFPIFPFFTQLTLLRLLIILTAFFGLLFLIRWKRNEPASIQNIAYVFLNPLVLIESVANVHFEIVMLVFLMLTLYYVLSKKVVQTSIFLSFAIQIKLLPLLMLPLFLRFLGWTKTIAIGLLTTLVSVLLFAFYLDWENFRHFIQSVSQYFTLFEFNSILLYPYLLYGEASTGYMWTGLYTRRLAFWSSILILSIAFYGGRIRAVSWLRRVAAAFCIYLIFSSTNHPWYWIIPLGFYPFVQWKSLLYISALTPLSYLLYLNEVPLFIRPLLTGLHFTWLFYWLKEVGAISYLRSFFSGTGSYPIPPQG